VRLSPLGTSATNWPVVPAPDDRWLWLWSSRWNENWRGKPKYPEKTYSSATMSTTNLTWFDLGTKSGRRGGKPATNRISYGAALWCVGQGLNDGAIRPTTYLNKSLGHPYSRGWRWLEALSRLRFPRRWMWWTPCSLVKGFQRNLPTASLIKKRILFFLIVRVSNPCVSRHVWCLGFWCVMGYGAMCSDGRYHRFGGTNLTSQCHMSYDSNHQDREICHCDVTYIQ
jgi:hypothetical protein